MKDAKVRDLGKTMSTLDTSSALEIALCNRKSRELLCGSGEGLQTIRTTSASTAIHVVERGEGVG